MKNETFIQLKFLIKNTNLISLISVQEKVEN
uniref:Uncharacterized protein n=1 Tax=CrAss-like virus sp. ctYsL76 TaxID=2826826 RepID=A0A8S5QMX6_9CAUD|nr:MAG TPA: hypothetical protein [CrAss-like virus sp. ctYsL76]